MNLRGWPPEWRTDLDFILEDAASHKDVADRRRALLAALDQAAADGQPWVRYVFEEFRDEGADRFLKWYDNRTKSVAFVEPGSGRLLNKPQVVGKQKRTESGTEYQRELITVMSWADLRRTRSERLTQADAATSTVALIDKLLTLQVTCPEADNPQEAADMLGLDLQDWLREGGA